MVSGAEHIARRRRPAESMRKSSASELRVHVEIGQQVEVPFV